MSRIVLALLFSVVWIDAWPQPADAAVRARMLGSPPLDSFYPASMERRRVAGAAARARVCVDANSRITGEPEVVVSSFFTEFDAAVVSMLKKGKYAAGEVDEKPVPSCVSLAVYGVLRGKVSERNREAIRVYLTEVNKSLPTIDGDLEIRDARWLDDKIVWTKVFWKETAADYIDADLRAAYRFYRDKEMRQHCKNKIFQDIFRAGISVVSWYSTSDRKTLFGIVTNEESCS
jgi:hypothetical protein